MSFLERSIVVGMIGFAALATSVGAQAPAAADGTTVVIVHGAFDTGSSWNEVIPQLQAKGLNVVAVANPLSSLADDVAATRRVLDVVTGPVVLVGHSWGGMVITEIGTHERVKALVYVASFAPSEGQSIDDLTKDYPRASGLAHVVADKEGFVTADTRLMAVTQGPIRGKNFAEKVTAAAWRNKPSWFVVSEKDLMIQPALQKANAEKISARIISLPASHVPQLSMPSQVADAIIAAATGLERDTK
jgi:pimeloyl-ACP methyl ester carboxylesterase